MLRRILDAAFGVPGVSLITRMFQYDNRRHVHYTEWNDIRMDDTRLHLRFTDIAGSVVAGTYAMNVAYAVANNGPLFYTAGAICGLYYFAETGYAMVAGRGRDNRAPAPGWGWSAVALGGFVANELFSYFKDALPSPSLVTGFLAGYSVDKWPESEQWIKETREALFKFDVELSPLPAFRRCLELGKTTLFEQRQVV